MQHMYWTYSELKEVWFLPSAKRYWCHRERQRREAIRAKLHAVRWWESDYRPRAEAMKWPGIVGKLHARCEVVKKAAGSKLMKMLALFTAIRATSRIATPSKATIFWISNPPKGIFCIKKTELKKTEMFCFGKWVFLSHLGGRGLWKPSHCYALFFGTLRAGQVVHFLPERGQSRDFTQSKVSVRIFISDKSMAILLTAEWEPRLQAYPSTARAWLHSSRRTERHGIKMDISKNGHVRWATHSPGVVPKADCYESSQILSRILSCKHSYVLEQKTRGRTTKDTLPQTNIPKASRSTTTSGRLSRVCRGSTKRSNFATKSFLGTKVDKWPLEQTKLLISRCTEYENMDTFLKDSVHRRPVNLFFFFF